MEVLIGQLKFIELKTGSTPTSFCVEVDQGLSATQKTLPTRCLYDRRGSEFFEAITDLPEYYLTRSEAQIFDRYATEIVGGCPCCKTIVEFGSGSSRKTRKLLEAYFAERDTLTYVPIDISADFLRETAHTLMESYPRLSVVAVTGEYFAAADALPSADYGQLILFLGSNIGNLPRDEATDFLGRVSRQMSSSDRFLVGIDLVKDPDIITAAYNDSRGVTAKFNKNLLARINSELEANFDLSKFEHHAPYDPIEQRVEMRLCALEAQEVRVGAIGKVFHFDKGEFIHSEWSHKYTVDSFRQFASDVGLQISRTWYDEREWFAAVMLEKAQ